MLAATASEDERELYLKEADTYLMEGLTDLYSDVNAQVKALAWRIIDKFTVYDEKLVFEFKSGPTIEVDA